VQPKKATLIFVWSFWNMVLISSTGIWYDIDMKFQIQFLFCASDVTET